MRPLRTTALVTSETAHRYSTYPVNKFTVKFSILARIFNAKRFPPVCADKHLTRCKTSATDIKVIYVGFQVGAHSRYPTPSKLVVTTEYGGAQNFS